MSDKISRAELFDRLATITAEDANDMKAKIYAAIQGMEAADRPKEVIAQITFDEEKLREIVKEAVERFKEEYEIADRPQGKWKAKSFHEYFCHNCGFSFDVMKCEFLENMKYCPNCGVPKGADDETE